LDKQQKFTEPNIGTQKLLLNQKKGKYAPTVENMRNALLTSLLYNMNDFIAKKTSHTMPYLFKLQRRMKKEASWKRNKVVN